MKIKIIGPGLVVNHPAAIIYKALVDAGFKVELEEFDGQFQDVDKEGWPQNQLDILERVKQLYPGNIERTIIKINVDAQPWGG